MQRAIRLLLFFFPEDCRRVYAAVLLAAVAALIPALRACRVNPVDALRRE